MLKPESMGQRLVRLFMLLSLVVVMVVGNGGNIEAY